VSVGIRRELLGALPVSALALTLDVGVLYGLVSGLHWHYLPAATLGFMAGLSLNYALSVRYVFEHHRLASRPREFAVFAAIGVGGLAVNAGLLALSVEALGLHYLMGKAIAAGGTFMFNFGTRRWMLFTPGEGQDD